MDNSKLQSTHVGKLLNNLGTIYEMGRRMFEQIFVENPQYLVYIDLRDATNWHNHINFKIHVQVT